MFAHHHTLGVGKRPSPGRNALLLAVLAAILVVPVAGVGEAPYGWTVASLTAVVVLATLVGYRRPICRGSTSCATV